MVPRVYMEGAFNLMAVDLHLTREKMRELFRALEERSASSNCWTSSSSSPRTR